MPLYLAIGFLEWYENEQSDKRRLSPILLLPLEVNRKSIREGFTLCLADDDQRINVTLLELLNKDFDIEISGLDPLPEDESGLDVSQILRRVRQAIRDIDRWNVLDEARIGFFSFTKLLMWRDLNDRIGDMLKNSVVDHLVNHPDEPFDPDCRLPSPESLDKERAPNSTYCPLSADSSQLAAIFAASEGRSFVLKGPPGTGKSQTIANLIAHCLTEEKTVLFVSEKMAALNVVHRRLVKVGFDGRFCLELHSNKVKKREVINQLGNALDQISIHGLAEWEQEASRLEELRNELNSYVDSLHKKRGTGETVFQATSRLIGLRDIPRVNLSSSSPEALDAEGLWLLRDLVERASTVGKACGEVKGQPWEAVRNTNWTPSWEEAVHKAIAELRTVTDELSVQACKCSKVLGLGDDGWSFVELDLLNKIAIKLMSLPAPPTQLLVKPDWDEIKIQVGVSGLKLARLGISYARKLGEISTTKLLTST